jgi:hypothetical protein
MVGCLVPLFGWLLMGPVACLAADAEPAQTRGQSDPAQAESPTQEVAFLHYKAPLPAAWIAEQPASSMRLVQYRVPGAGADEARFVIYYFGKGQGGSVKANIARWQSQFSGPDGSAVEPIVERFPVGKNSVTLVELMGNYARGVGAGPSGEFKEKQTLLAAVVETPSGNLYPQLHGASELVAQQKAGFRAFLRGIRLVAGAE